MNRLIVILLVALCGAGNLAGASSDADLIHALTAAAEKNFSGVVLLAKDGNPIARRSPPLGKLYGTRRQHPYHQRAAT
jgi:hypothetical protein